MKQRTTAPKKGDKWYSTSNPFAGSAYDMFTHNGNCTHYCYGRGSEVLGKKSNLPTCDANNWFAKAKKLGFKTGSTPKVGSIGVYQHTKKKGGHVFFVEDILSNGNIMSSMSGWKSFIFKRKELSKKSGYLYNDYKLLGFIYLIDEPTPTPTPTPEKRGYTGDYPTIPKRGYFKVGDKGTQVKNLQKLLNWINDSKLSVDGVIGPKTIAGIKPAQKRIGTTQDGKWGANSNKKAKNYKK